MKKIVMFAFAVLLCSVAASAASLTAPCSSADVNSAVENITCPLFDNTGGLTLTGVKLTLLSANLVTDITYQAQAVAGTGTTNSVGPGNWSASNPVPNVGSPFPIGGGGITMSPSAFATHNLAAFSDTFGSPDTSTGALAGPLDFFAAAVGGYIGIGNFVFTSTGSVPTTLTLTGSVDAFKNITYNSLWSITYTYDIPRQDVPEPGTFALLGGALLGLGALARRKK